MDDTTRLESRLSRLGWRASRSGIEGYHRSYEMETPEGDEIKVDFNSRREMVRLQVSIAREFGRQYVAVIKSGTILQEKDFTSRRSVDLSSRLIPLRRYFEFLPDSGALRAMGGSYGYPTTVSDTPGRRFSMSPQFLARRSQSGMRRLLRLLRGHREATLGERIRERIVSEGILVLPALAIAAAYQSHVIGLAECAGLLGFLGVMTGALEWIIGRDPFLPRVALLLMASGAAVYTEIQYRMFSIFL
ncbi:MAG: hypothetical protein HY042_01560 [Spirochaetia bacterium]|nr:hypothetical protein [Spirochaetia bacterium]